MKPRTRSWLGLIGSASVVLAHDFTAASARPAPPAQKRAVAAFDPWSLAPEYRRTILLEPATLSPFRRPEARSAQAAATVPRPAGPNISGVLSKFHELGLTGVIPSTLRRPGLIVLGGNIYREGDELTVSPPHGRHPGPLLAEHRVILRSVTAEALGLSVSHAGDPPTAPQDIPVGLREFRER